MLLRMEGVSRSFGNRTLFRDVSLTIHARDRIGLVGPNGAGKTTLLHIAAGFEAPDSGQVSRPRDVRVGMLRQEIDPGLQRTVRDEVASVFAELDALEVKLSELEAQMAEVSQGGGEIPAELADRYDDCRTRFELGGGFERGARVDRVLAGLGFDNARSARALATFSGGWLMRVELAKLLLAAPDVLLLDEPTNHLDLPSIQWFEETITEYPGAVVIISHDRTFLRRHVNRVAELEHGGLTAFDGSFDRYLQDKALRREERLAQKRTQDRKIAETERFIARFRAKASKAKQVQSRVKALEKLDRIEVAEDRTRRMRLRIPPVARAGESILRLENIHKSYAETVVYSGIDFAIARGERVALVGPNGAGKSTLLRIAAGVLPFDRGERTVGHNVQIAFYAQHQLEVLDPSRTVLAELETVARVDDTPRLRGHLGAFLFSGDDIDKKVSVLSGGEKARLALAKLLLHPTNFLVLDEPTNHLDLVSREVLEEALAGYTGTLLLISHDRAFINALVNRVVEVDDGRLEAYPGNYDEYLRRQSRVADTGRADAAASAPPAVETATPTAPAAPSESESIAKPPSKQERIAAREATKQQARRHQRAARRLAEVEAEILGHEENLEQLSWRLGDPDLHRDPDRLRAIESERGELRETIDGLYREWERLAAEVEAGQQIDA